MFNDALEAGTDPRAMLIDGAVGGLFGVTSYGFSQALKYNRYKSCGDISTKAKQSVVDDVLDKTDDVANMVDDANVSGKTIEINNPVLDNIRIGSALKDDSLHAFNDIIDNYAGDATKFSLTGGDGVERTLYQIEG